MPTIVVLLPHGFAAEVVTEETERGIYVPPLLPPAEHATSCRCEACVLVRGLTRERGVA